MTDGEFVSAVTALDERVAELDGGGFRLTPAELHARLGEELGVEVWVKDETGNVTGTHKGRHLMGLALHLAVEGVPLSRRLAISSCGNAALAAAALARAAGRPLEVFVPLWASPSVLNALEALEAEVVVCPRTPGQEGDPCHAGFREALGSGAWPFCAVGVENILTIDGGRTLAFELLESLRSADCELDAVFVQVGGGALASSVAQGFVEAAAAGVIGQPPKLFAVQTQGCAPLSRAWELFERAVNADGLDAAVRRAARAPDAFMRPWVFEDDAPASAASGILDDVTYDWLPLAWTMSTFGGEPVVVREETVLEANALARRLTGVLVDATGSAGLAGLLAARRCGLLRAGAKVAVLFTGADRSAFP